MGYAFHEDLIRSLFEDGLTYSEIAEELEKQTGMSGTESGIQDYCRRQDWFEYRARHLRIRHSNDSSSSPDERWERYY